MLMTTEVFDRMLSRGRASRTRGPRASEAAGVFAWYKLRILAEYERSSRDAKGRCCDGKACTPR